MLTTVHRQPLCEFAHKSYTLKQKRKTIQDVENLIAVGNNISIACASVKIERSVFYRGKKLLSKISGQTAKTSETAVITSETPFDVGEIPLTDEEVMAFFDMPLDGVNVPVPVANVVIGDILPTVMHVSS